MTPVISKYLSISIFLLFGAHQILAQVPDTLDITPDSTGFEVPVDSLAKEKKKWKWPPWKGWETPGIGGIRVGTDIYYLAFTGIDPDFQGSEYYADLMINNTFYLNAAIGTAQTNRADGGSFFYENKGEFYRFGLEYNLWHKKTREDAFFIGLQYAVATFEHSVIFRADRNYWDRVNNPNLEDPSNPPPSVPEYDATGLEASWFEVTGGFKVRIINNFFGSVTARIKNILNADDANQLTIVDIPGYGIYDNDRRLNISYHLLYKLPLDLFKKKKDKEEKSKKKRKGKKGEATMPAEGGEN